MNKRTSVISRPLLILVGIVIATELVLNILGMVITTPTASHRAVSRELSQVQPAFDEKSAEAANKKYDELFKSEEGQYVQKAGLFVAITQLFITLVIIVALHSRIRKKRLAQDAVAATAFNYTFATLVVMVASYFIGAWYIGATSTALLPFLLSVVWGGLFSFVMTYLAAWLLDKRYTSKHSLDVE